jgi:hydrogenase maturation protease
VACLECERGGLDLLDTLAGFEQAIILDAAQTGSHPPGTILEMTLHAPYLHECSPSLHTIGIGGVLALGETAGVDLPGEVTIYGVEAADIETFGSGCTPAVEASIPRVLTRLRDNLTTLIPDLRFASSVHTETVSL